MRDKGEAGPPLGLPPSCLSMFEENTCILNGAAFLFRDVADFMYFRLLLLHYGMPL